MVTCDVLRGYNNCTVIVVVNPVIESNKASEQVRRNPEESEKVRVRK